MSLSHFNKKNKNIEMVDISKKIKQKDMQRQDL